MVPRRGSIERVLIAWNASREAARAVHSRLPLMVGYNTVSVVPFNPDQNEDWQICCALIDHLARRLYASTETIRMQL